MRTWWENEDIFQRFREWLSQTGEELAALAAQETDSPSPRDDTTFDKPEWLDELDRFDEPDESNGEVEDVDPAYEPAPELPAVGFIELLEAFTALRHETKLQTKAGRGLEDSVQASLQGLDRAIRQFETVQARETEAAERAAKPFAEALANLDEALARGAEAIASSHRQAAQAVPRQLHSALDERFQQLTWWQRRFARPWHRHVQSVCEAEVAAAIDSALSRAMEGYQLIRARLRRVMLEQEVARIDCVGETVDPARMTVVELVDDPQAEQGVVLEEVRPGYTYRGKVIRFAEVRAARKDARPVVSS
ncbi:MAG: nucleotide exchange factor GrpE [Pirellulaceae bacterium]